MVAIAGLFILVYFATLLLVMLAAGIPFWILFIRWLRGRRSRTAMVGIIVTGIVGGLATDAFVIGVAFIAFLGAS